VTTLWDTTGSAVVKALQAERRMAGSVSAGLALTLVVVVEEKDVAEAERAATRAAAEHPCRLLVVVRRRPDAAEPRLDAEVTIGDRLGPGEAVSMRMYGRLALHAESVVLPLLAPDTPVVTWWRTPPPELIAHDPLGVLSERRVTDCSLAPDPLQALATRADDYAPGDTDLAWTRSTTWRALCAAALDPVRERPAAGRVSGAPGDPTRALLAGWLSRRLGVEVETVDSDSGGRGRGDGVEAVELLLEDAGPVSITRADARSARLTTPGRPDRVMPLPARETGDLLAEELRRLDPDDTYAEALEAATGRTGLSDRPRTRAHVWHDPTDSSSPDPALTTT
jgi:glucose-6-phosphate dehydrogenase assembly protein OpcA